MLEIVICVLLGVLIVLAIVGIFVTIKSKSSTKLSQNDKDDILKSFNGNVDFISKSLTQTQKANNEALLLGLRTFQENLSANNVALEKRILELSKLQEEKLEAIRLSNERHIKMLQEDNNRQLDKMRETVDEKLSKTINERFEQTFKVLSEQLESVYKSLGEMQNIATDVGSLTKMLSNVKTTGIFGEVQLGAIFEQILTKDQYETNFVTGEGKEPVEFAVKLPGQNDGEFVYMPVDSKFPYTIYSDLQNAYEKNDLELVKQKKELLKATINSMAKDINTKYICPPKTTNFAVMFLPIEGLYAEIAKLGLIEQLQSKYGVTIAGPTTMSALLNSLQMGFRTLAIQKKSGQVWQVLGAVRTEFDKFSGLVEKIRGQFEKTSKDFDSLVGTRTRLLANKLRSVEKLDNGESLKVLGLEEEQSEDDSEE